MLLFFLPSGHGLASGVAKSAGPQRDAAWTPSKKNLCARPRFVLFERPGLSKGRGRGRLNKEQCDAEARQRLGPETIVPGSGTP